MATSSLTSTSLDTPQLVEHISHGLSYSPFSVRWVPSSARLAVLGVTPRGEGRLEVLQMSKGKLVSMATVAAGSRGIKCGTFGSSDFERRELATGDYDGTVAIWDLERAQSGPIFRVTKAHDSIINCIDGVGGLNIGKGAPELVTGGRDGCVRVWDPRVQEAVMELLPEETASSSKKGSVEGGAEGEAKKPGAAAGPITKKSAGGRDCWAVAFGHAFSESERTVAAGYDNGDVKLLCMRTRKVIWETNVGNGVVGLEFDRKDIEMNKLAVTSLEARFRVYDMRTRHEEQGYAYVTKQQHKSTVWSARFLPQDREVFMTSGGNGALSLFRYRYPKGGRRVLDDPKKPETARGVAGECELVNTLKLSEQPVVSFDWNREKRGLAAAACLDQTVKVVVATKLAKLN